ncbi:MAG: BatD family protein, partial [Candidatus Hydrogenedentes bacterium]|nr:BatD family protein [Candidatus Hydrogenedentota bacterium]
MIDGEEYATKPIPLTVTKGGPAPELPLRRGGRQQPLRSETSAPTLEDTVVFECGVDKQEVYQGEPLTLTIRILELDNPNVGTIGRPQFEPPSTEGFYAGPMHQTDSRDIRNGWPYVVKELRQTLFPTGVGEYTVGTASWQATVRAITQQGLRTDQKALTTRPIPVTVKALPARPPGFTGAVGQFQARLGMREQTLTQGVPTILELSIAGHGNPNAISAPELPPFSWAQVSGPEVDTQHDDQEWTQIEKVFRYTLTPLEAGTFQTPALRFIYFDPARESFETEDLPPLSLQVEASTESHRLVAVGGSENAPQQDVKILAQDLLPIITGETALRARKSARASVAPTFLGPPILYGGFFAYMRRKRRLAEDPGYARRVFARARSQKRLAHLAKSGEPSEDLYRAVMGYIADVFNSNETGMTSHDAQALLEREGVDAEVGESLVKILRACERRRYAGVSLRQEEVQALAE